MQITFLDIFFISMIIFKLYRIAYEIFTILIHFVSIVGDRLLVDIK